MASAHWSEAQETPSASTDRSWRSSLLTYGSWHHGRHVEKSLSGRCQSIPTRRRCQVRPADIQAALTVPGRRRLSPEALSSLLWAKERGLIRGRLNLARTDLRGVDLSEPHLEESLLASVELPGSLRRILGWLTQRPQSEYCRGGGPAARILSPSPKATNGAIRATRRGARVTDFDCAASGGLSTGATSPGPAASSPTLINGRGF